MPQNGKADKEELIMFFQLLGHENKKCFVSNIEHIRLDNLNHIDMSPSQPLAGQLVEYGIILTFGNFGTIIL